MRKNFTLLFLIGIFGLFTTNLFAQQDATIDPADIRFWVGEGENEVVFIVNWAEPDTALAWGYRFSGENVTVQQMMDDIVNAETRFGYGASGSWVTEIFYEESGGLALHLTPDGYWMYVVNGNPVELFFDEQTVSDGDYVKWGDTNCGTMIDPENWIYVWEKEVAPVYPIGVEAMIDPSEIQYWIGQGENEVVFAVNWAEPNICLAWGFRFSEETLILKEIMDAIKEADGRFDYVVGSWGVDDITFNEGELHLGVSEYSYFMYNVNGEQAWYGFDQQTIANGDFIKWGDIACGTEIAAWTYVWEQPVEPVSVYDGMGENMNSSLSVYPNPAISETFVTLENAGMNTVSVYDMQGRLISKESIDAMAGEQVRICTEKLTAGVYFINVSDNSAVRTAKLVVK